MDRMGHPIDYAEQPDPTGWPRLSSSASASWPAARDAVLGDNVFYGAGLSEQLRQGGEPRPRRDRVRLSCAGSRALRGRRTRFDRPRDLDRGEARAPKSHWAVTGLYFYDYRVIEIAKSSNRRRAANMRSPTSIASIWSRRLDVERIGRGFAWLDTGTPNADRRREFVRTLEQRQGTKISCPEEIAFDLGLIDLAQFKRLIARFGKSAYGQYLQSVLNERNQGSGGALI